MVFTVTISIRVLNEVRIISEPMPDFCMRHFLLVFAGAEVSSLSSTTVYMYAHNHKTPTTEFQGSQRYAGMMFFD